MTKPGPKPGSGGISAWVAAALQAGPKTLHEIQMGSGFSPKQVENTVYQMVQRGAVVVSDKRGAGKVRPSKLYQLPEEITLARCVSRPARAKAGNPTRNLEDLFHGVVASRMAKTHRTL
jgi:hypothetical protein